jgi:hypothetical protein
MDKTKQKDKEDMKEESERNETSNEQIEEAEPGDHNPNKNEEARKNLNEHTKRDND